jgi:hypothetical protein
VEVAPGQLEPLFLAEMAKDIAQVATSDRRMQRHVLLGMRRVCQASVELGPRGRVWGANRGDGLTTAANP